MRERNRQRDEVMAAIRAGIKLESLEKNPEYADFFGPGEPVDLDKAEHTIGEPLNPDVLEDLAKFQFEKNFKVK